MLASLPYLVLRRLLALGAPDHRSDDAAQIEILVLHHQLQVLRRQVKCPVYGHRARALLAVSSISPRRQGVRSSPEGIETDDELAAVRSLGVTLGQGHLLARPSGVEAWTVAQSARRRTGASSSPPQRRKTEPAPDPAVLASRSAS
jgi:hypothetical protein